MKLIIGLGNPGDKYLFTRHNIGFMVLDYICKNFNSQFSFNSKFNCSIAKINYQNNMVLLVKPQTFMNLSGTGIIKIINFYKIDIKDILVIYDDISLNLGTLRFKNKGQSGGHNGIKSIINSLGNNCVFDRLKIGIGPQTPNVKSENFVLADFNNEELKIVKEVLKTCFLAFEFYLNNTFEKVQNKYN